LIIYQLLLSYWYETLCSCHINLTVVLTILYLLCQIQHPRYRLDRFDLVVTPRHDYYALTAKGQRETPWLFRRWITPREPPGPNVVCCSFSLKQKYFICLYSAVPVLNFELWKARSWLLEHFTRQILLHYELLLQTGMMNLLPCQSRW
jgi:hypothetical protein